MNRNKAVEIVVLHLGCYFAERTVVISQVGRHFFAIVGELRCSAVVVVIRAGFAVAHHNVVRQVARGANLPTLEFAANV